MRRQSSFERAHHARSANHHIVSNSMVLVVVMWSIARNGEMCSVGPLQTLTIGPIPWGFLWRFLRKYIRCVLTLIVRGMQVECVYVSM